MPYRLNGLWRGRLTAGALLALLWTGTLLWGFSSPGAVAAERPTPPDGYVWVEFPAGPSAILMPVGWHATTQVDGELSTLFLSKENVETVGRYRTGLSVNVIHHVRQQAGMTPSQFAQRSIATTTGSKEIIGQWSGPHQSGLSSFSFRYRDSEPSPTMLVHALFLADDQGDVLHVLVFGAPESEWERAWAHGERMLKLVVVG